MSDNKKDIYSLSLSHGDSNFRSIFSGSLKNDHHIFVVQKTEKLASALYLVTNYLSVTEPLRTKLRLSAIDLVSSSARPGVLEGDQTAFGSRCLEIGSLLRMAERAGLISGMNTKILCDEYAALASFFAEHYDTICHSVTIQNDTPTAAPKTAPPLGQPHIGQLQSNGTHKRHSNRQNMILGLFAKKDRITINDAVSSINGCSEKTIQREILTLVEEGVLLKEGERRWSTYRKAPGVQ